MCSIQLDGKEIHEMPSSATALERCKPIYVSTPGFPAHSLDEWLDIAKAANRDVRINALPAAAQNYIDNLRAC